MVRKISVAVFLFILPAALYVNALTLGHWSVTFRDPADGQVYHSDDVCGFPFPSYGHFLPVVHPASSDWEYCASFLNIAVNWLAALVSGAMLWLIFRNVRVPAWLRIVLIAGGYATVPIVLVFFLVDTQSWYSDFTVVSYHFWSLTIH